MASSSMSPQHDSFTTASSSSFHKKGEYPPAFSGIEPQLKRRKVSESSRLYDVFINHRGPDVKETLALQLYSSLQDLDIRAFLDSKEKELGDSFPSTIETAVRSAAVHIAIFSKRYAESPWCLAELALMLQTKAKIIPVFYGVEPSALRHIEKGVYGKAFSEYENKKRYMDKLDEWKKALQSISFIAGEEFKSLGGCEKIVSAVQKEVERTRCLHVAKYPVGLSKLVEDFEKQCIDKLVQDFESQCEMTKKEGTSKIVGIFGMGGVGKTTLSKELFNRKRPDYSRSCFLFDVREASARKDLPALQMKLLRDVFGAKEHPSFSSIEDGTSCLINHFARSGNRSFLIVLDDISHQEQLDALLPGDELNKSGNSLVIVTTRDVGVLINAGITVGYYLKGMDTDDAKELFCWHAFSQSYPSTGYENLVEQFVHVCAGLPLSLQVLGRHVHGQDQMFWELELKKAKKTLPQDIHKRLRISIDTLDNEEKQIFMDVACFFIGEKKKDAITVWEISGWNAQHALRRLKNKCLVEETENNEFRISFKGLVGNYREKVVLRMHDHLRDLGREMAEELNYPRRLWRTQHLQSLGAEGFKNIFTLPKIRYLHSFRDPSTDICITYFVGESENMGELSSTLLWLELRVRRHKLSNIPPWIALQNILSLSISCGSLERLWQNNEQAPFMLKELRISNISELRELNLGNLRCLERITISKCEILQSLKGINDLMKLVQLKISKCEKLEELSLVQLSCLERIKISDCPELKLFILPYLKKLMKLYVSGCHVIESSLVQLTCLEKVGFSTCPYLKRAGGTYDLPKLSEFHIEKFTKLEEINFSKMSSLENITVSECQMLKSLKGINGLAKLVELNISACEKLEELSLLELSCLEKIRISYCPCLKSVAGMSDLRRLVELNINECWELELSLVQPSCLQKITISGYLPSVTLSHLMNLEELNFIKFANIGELSLVQLSYLRGISIPGFLKVSSIEVRGCKRLSRVDFENLMNVVKLTICDCPELENLQELESLRQIKMILLNKCPKLKKIALPATLTKLTMQSSREFQTVAGIYCSTDVEEMLISKCSELEFNELRIAQLKLLKTIVIDSCGKMQKITGTENLHSLERVQLFYCDNETVRNFILNLKKLPSDFIQVVGRAVDGAESNLNTSFFSDENISTGSVSQISTGDTNPDYLVSAIILCAVVVVNSRTAANMMNDFIRGCDSNPWLKFEVRQGEWLITSVITDQDEIHTYILNKASCFPFDYVFTDHAVTEDIVVKKGYKVTIPGKKGEGHKALSVLHKIIEKLYQK